MLGSLTHETLRKERQALIDAAHRPDGPAARRERSGVARRHFRHSQAITGSLELFEGLSRRELREVRKLFSFVDLADGQRFGRQGQRCSELAVVVQGQIAISLDERPLAVIPEGCFFGAVAMLDMADRARRGAPIAIGETRLALAGRTEFAQLLERFPVLSDRIHTIASARSDSLSRMRAGQLQADTRSIEYPVHVLA